MTAAVFVGPTLSATDGAKILAAEFRTPVRLGDVYRVVSESRPRAVGIVDGYFQWVPAVWHKEILWAIEQGVHVFGAASMGALRAVELAPMGMHGVGRIFEAYRDGRLHGVDDDPFEDDDEVAIVHGPPESNYRGRSEAMVDIRCTLARAAEERVIAQATCRALVAAAKAAFFPDRCYAALLAHGRAAGMPEYELAALERWLPSGRIDQKRLDALAMLEAMRDFLGADPPPARAVVTFERTAFWERAEVAFREAVERPAVSPLTALGLDVAECESLGVDELCSWYFARVAGIPAPGDLDGWVRDAGYSDPREFHHAVFAEYLRQAPGPGGRT